MRQRLAGRLTGPVTKWIVLAAWLIVIVVMSGFASKLGDVQNNQTKSWLPSSAESVEALDRLPKTLDQNAFTTILLYQRDTGLTPADFTAIDAQAARLATLHGVKAKTLAVPTDATTGVSQGLVSQDGTVAETVFDIDLGSKAFQLLPDLAKQIRALATLPGGHVYLTGQGGQGADQSTAFAGIDGKLLYSAVGVVVLILLLTYRSPILWLLPLLGAVSALQVSKGVIYLLAAHAGLVVNAQNEGILTVIVLGAGTDYALLLVARYREELRRHEDRHEAMAFGLHRAAPAIIASAATVVLGMLCLLAASMNSTSGLGPVAAIGIGVGLLVMVTLLPALLVICGRWVFWPTKPTYRSSEPTTEGFWARVGTRIARRPRATWIVTALILLVACGGLLTMHVRALSDAESYTTTFDSVTGEKVLLAHGLADPSAPLEVVADAGSGDAVVQALTGVKGLSDPMVLTPAGVPVFAVADLGYDPVSSQAAHVVDEARTALRAVPGAHAQVTGAAALNRDQITAAGHDDKVVLPLILAVVMIVLMVLLRAILAPVLLALTVVLSYGAALGVSVLAFHTIFGFAAEEPAFPLYVFVFLVALGIDYNIFLMTRVREEAQTHTTREAALIALGSTGGVITSAGLVLAATFAVLSTLPIVTFVEIGVAVAFGVVLDTMVVRSVLVTALNLDLGERIWWPRRRPGKAPQSFSDAT